MGEGAGGYFFQHGHQLEIGVGRGDFQLGDQSVHLGERDDDGDLLRHRVANAALGVHHHTLHCVHADDASIRHSQSGRDFARETHVTWSVDEVNEVRFVVRVAEEKRDGRRGDADSTLLLGECCVCITNFLVKIPRSFVSRFD